MPKLFCQVFYDERFFRIKILGSENLRFSTYSLTKGISRYVIECPPAPSPSTPRLRGLVGSLAHELKYPPIPLPDYLLPSVL